LEGVNELSSVIDSMNSLGVPSDNYVVDLSIARGLDYYTGTVYETILVDNPKLGSICSGGRYENLASHFTDKKLPGVGISIGLTRLLSKLFAMNSIDTKQATTSKVLFTTFEDVDINIYFSLARKLRENNIACEVYTEGKKLGDQLKYADKKGVQLAVIYGKDEIHKKVLSVKFLNTGEIQEVKEGDFIEFVIDSLK
jgi:histidyl-tRNA synthetase